MFNQIFCGNHLDILPRFPDETFDMFLTSPPYDNLRSYEGYDFQFEPLARELFRVLKPGGVGVWVVCDETINGGETGTSFKQALYFMECGFKLHDTMIYAKQNTMPMFYNAKRYNHQFEYMFVLTKGGMPKSFTPVRISKVVGFQTGNGQITRKTSNHLEVKRTITRSSAPDKLATNIWTYNTGHNQTTKDSEAFEHPAIFPEKLAEDHILSWSNPGDVILDPMCGSGTTCKMAAKHGRKYVGIDIAEKYCEIARKRVALIEAQPMLFNEGTQANNAFAGDFDGAGEISSVPASAEAAPSRA